MTQENESLEELVVLAKGGDKLALEDLVRQIQDQVYRLSLRMVVDPDEAMSSCQEILILVVTKLSTFEARSRFRTWVYRIGMNYLLSQKRKLQLSFEMFEADLMNGLEDTDADDASDEVLLNELRLACTSAMLLCLDEKHRAAYLIGEIFEVAPNEAAGILSLSPENYRKRLSRARSAVLTFTQKTCGLVNENAACRCKKRIAPALAQRRIRPGQVVYSAGAPAYSQVEEEAKELIGEIRALKLQKSGGLPPCPEDMGRLITGLSASPN